MSILNSLRAEQNSTTSHVYEEGVVSRYNDGVIEVTGLKNVKYYEVLEVLIDNSILEALVLEINETITKAVLLSALTVSAGSRVLSRSKKLSLIIDPQKRGVIYNALGSIELDLLDQQSVKSNIISLDIENDAPALMSREPVTRPISTGILAIDALVNVGKGQRQLIIGDRQTGKTSIALDAIINQKGKDVICIYVAIGQKRSNVIGVVNSLKKNLSLDYSVIFNASGDESCAMQYLAPFAAATLGQYLMEQGKDVLVVYDDLSKHAIAWRQLSLLLKRPVGREAYPGDVFYLHSRLLERGGQLEDQYKGGSMTALPIIETLANDVTGYIPTNVISITDGQIYLESSMFNSGVRPAISAGLSVSRVGGAAQTKSIKKNSGKMKLDLSQYRELASFSQIGSGLDAGTKQTLDHGKVLTRALIQKNNNPLSLAQMIARLKLASSNALDKCSIEKIDRAFIDLDEYIDRLIDPIIDSINDAKWSDDIDKHIIELVDKFIKSII